MKPKQKEVTMWAIWCPYFEIILDNTFSRKRYDSWNNFFMDTNNTQFVNKKTALKCGYRAVKGKFVWDEK